MKKTIGKKKKVWVGWMIYNWGKPCSKLFDSQNEALQNCCGTSADSTQYSLHKMEVREL